LLHDLGEVLAARTMGTKAAPRSEIELDGVSELHRSKPPRTRTP
jgi:hypothetical protein